MWANARLFFVAGSVFFVVLSAAATPASADVDDGRYAIIEGRAGGTSYSGFLDIRTVDGQLRVDKQTPLHSAAGVGVRHGDHLFVVFGPRAVLALYSANDDFSRLRESSVVNGRRNVRMLERDGFGSGWFEGDFAAGERNRLELTEGFGSWFGQRRTGKAIERGIGDFRGDQLAMAWGEGAELWIYELSERGIRGVKSRIDPTVAPATETLSQRGPLPELRAVERLACQCNAATCPEDALTALELFYHRYKSTRNSRSADAEIRRRSQHATVCLMRRGISPQRLARALETEIRSASTSR